MVPRNSGNNAKNQHSANKKYESNASYTLDAASAFLNKGANVSVNSNNNSHSSANNVCSNKENSKPSEVYFKKPRTCLLDGYKHNWKAANNHFQRYGDVKPREERRPTVMDLANQACVLQKVDGWKVFHLTSQMEELVILLLSVKCVLNFSYLK